MLTNERFESARKRVEIPLCAATVKDRNFLLNCLLLSPERGDEGVGVFPESKYREVFLQPDERGLQAWMVLGMEFEGGNLISEKDLGQRFSLAHYNRMIEVEGIDGQELQGRLYEDAVKYVEENVLRVKLGQLDLIQKDGDLYSPKFGGKSLLTSCHDAVLARKEKGINFERVNHEGLGVYNLIKLLEVMNVGDVAVIVSPPDGGDANTEGYSMVYLYEKREDGLVWFGAVRDEHRRMEDWRDFARESSLWQTDWDQYDHLEFVSLPYVAKGGLIDLLHKLGVRERVGIPDWIMREAKVAARLVTENLNVGNTVFAQKILDSFKTAVIAGRKQTTPVDEGYSVAKMVVDPRYLMMVNHQFNNSGGQDVLNASGLCGVDERMGLMGDLINPIEQLRRDNNLQSRVMGVNESSVATTSSGSEEKVDMRCGLCCGAEVVKKDGYYVCKNPSCNGKIECSKIDKAG